MKLKNNKGISAIDIAVSIAIIIIFLTMITSIVSNTNLNKEKVKRESTATSYAVKEIETIKGQGYITTPIGKEYDGKGIEQEDVIADEDIYNTKDDGSKEFTGYHKKITIKDYSLLQKENNPNQETSVKSDIVKKITVEISYKFSGKDKNVTVSTYVAK